MGWLTSSVSAASASCEIGEDERLVTLLTPESSRAVGEPAEKDLYLLKDQLHSLRVPPGMGWIFARFLFMWYAVVRSSRVRAFLEYMAKHSLNFGRAPGPSGDRGDVPLKVPWGDGGVCRLMYDVHQTLSFCSLYSGSPLSSWPQPRRSDGDVAPRWDTREDFGLHFFIFPPPRVAWWLLMCRCQLCNKTAVASVRAGGRFKSHVESGLSVVVEWRHHSEQAGTPRRATKRLLRQVQTPDPRGTMADQPRRYWCTYQQHCGNAGSGITGACTSGIAGMPGPHDPKERKAPTQGLEGTNPTAGSNPRTGRRYFLTRSGSTT